MDEWCGLHPVIPSLLELRGWISFSLNISRAGICSNWKYRWVARSFPPPPPKVTIKMQSKVVPIFMSSLFHLINMSIPFRVLHRGQTPKEENVLTCKVEAPSITAKAPRRSGAEQAFSPQCPKVTETPLTVYFVCHIGHKIDNCLPGMFCCCFFDRGT